MMMMMTKMIVVITALTVDIDPSQTSWQAERISGSADDDDDMKYLIK